MSDIRLKKITIEPSETLIIQNENINIINTDISTNRLSGSLIVNGGIGINNTYDSTSSTSGGALTIGGGIAVKNQAFFGNNVILDTNTSTLSINGITTNRLFLDTVSNKQFYISPDGITNRFNLYDTTLSINITKNSSNLTSGALVINGGISINCTYNSTSATSGGALTIGGGMAIDGDIYASKSITLETNNTGLLINYPTTGNSQITLRGSSGNSSTINMVNSDLTISNNNNIICNTSNGNIVFSNTATLHSFTIYPEHSEFNKYIHITNTAESLNSTTGSLLINGGITIKCTTDAISSNNGGSITIFGGIGINKKTFTNDSIGIELLNDNKQNKLVLYQPSNNLSESNLQTGIGVTSGSLRFQLYDTSNDYLFYSSNSSGNSSEVFRIKGTNEVQFIGSDQRYSILAGGNTSNDLSIQSQGIATPFSLCYFTKDGDANDSNDIKIFGKGLPNNIINSEYLKIGWTGTSDYIISTNKTGTGIATPLILETNTNSNQFKLLTNGTITCSSTNISINSTTGGLVLSGGLSISNTTDTSSLTNGGSLTIAGGVSVAKSIYIGNTLNISVGTDTISIYSQNTSGDLLVSNPSDKFIFAGNNTNTSYDSNISLFSLNNKYSGNFQVFSISNSSNSTILSSNASGSGILHPIQLTVGLNTGIFLSTNGNIGINTTNSSFQLDINGTLQVNNYSNINSLTIYNTNPANSLSSGSLTVLGGTSISKNLYVGGKVMLTDSTLSSSTSASLYLSGGLSIVSSQNSTYGSGALTIIGGAYISNNVYIQQDLNIAGALLGTSSTLSNLLLSSTTISSNLTSGCLIINGGLTIKCSSNSSSLSSGGALTIAGGASINKTLYLGQDLTINGGIQNFYTNLNNLINMYDSSNLVRFSIDHNTINSNFSISRYDNSGSYVEKSIDISNSNGQITLNNSSSSVGINTGALISIGGITVNCTVDASSLGNGGSFTVLGGASISKNVYIGGDISLSSTTNSTNAVTGALQVAGGVGINGNVNINGNTVITGNLSIIGTTNTVYSTNTFLSDNIILINSGPSGTADGGILIQRYQINNDSSIGDVVNDISSQPIVDILPNQSGMTTTQVKLSTLASSIDNYYTGWWIKITSGFSNAQVRKITGYIGNTRVATIESIWTIQNPSIGDSANIYNKPYVGLIWNETADRFDLGTSINDPGNTSVALSSFSSLHLDNITLYNTSISTNTSTGSLIIKGGITIQSTYDATSLTSGSGLTIAGGASIAKSLYIGNKLYVGNVDITPNTHDAFSTIIFSAANNVTTATLLDYSDDTVWGFDIYLSIRLIATTNMYSNYNIRGINKNGSWEIITSYVGDSIVTFNITNTGQLQYSTPNFTGFTSLTFKYKVLTN